MPTFPCILEKQVDACSGILDQQTPASSGITGQKEPALLILPPPEPPGSHQKNHFRRGSGLCFALMYLCRDAWIHGDFLRWHYPDQVEGQNRFRFPLSQLPPAPLFLYLVLTILSQSLCKNNLHLPVIRTFVRQK